MRKRITAKIFFELEKIRKSNEIAAQNKADAAFAIPEISDLDNSIRSLTFEIVAKKKKGEDISKLSSEAENLEKLLIEKFQNHGFSPADFEVKYNCEKCKDTGHIKNHYCDCFVDRFVNEVKSISKLDIVAPYKFSDCSFKIVQNLQQREYLKRTFETAKKYCENFNFTKTRNFLLSGGTGTGKTFIASAIANDLCEKGYTVLFKSAYEMLSDMKINYLSSSQTFNDEHSIFDDYLTADLLVIDDLGTEQILRNITLEYLLMILSSREMNGKSTVVTTNLSTGLMDRYGDRIASRLTNKWNTIIRNLIGNDLRNSHNITNSK